MGTSEALWSPFCTAWAMDISFSAMVLAMDASTPGLSLTEKRK